MTSAEFESQYKILAQTFGAQTFGPNRGALLFKYVSDLPAKWWVSIVERVILVNDPRFNFAEAAAGERRAVIGVRLQRETSEAHENLARNMSDAGMENTLKQFNASSLWQAIENSKKGKGA
jgi:hypothetical protein